MKNRNKKLYRLVVLALFAAIEVAMYLMGLGLVPIGPALKLSFLTIPVAVGAMLLGPLEGMALGAVFGLCSYWDAFTGASLMTNAFFIADPINTFILCVVMRALVGLAVGGAFKLLQKIDPTRIICYYAGALLAPLSNTILFMGYIVLVFYETDYVQRLVITKGAANPFMFIVLLVGVQGLIEALVCTVAAGTTAKGVSKAMKRLD